IDHRLTGAEKRRLLDRARPSVVIDAAGETMFGGGEPADPERAWAVVATSGTAGEPKLAELPRQALETAVDGSLAALGLEPGAPRSVAPPHVWAAASCRPTASPRRAAVPRTTAFHSRASRSASLRERSSSGVRRSWRAIEVIPPRPRRPSPPTDGSALRTPDG